VPAIIIAKTEMQRSDVQKNFEEEIAFVYILNWLQYIFASVVIL